MCKIIVEYTRMQKVQPILGIFQRAKSAFVLTNPLKKSIINATL